MDVTPEAVTDSLAQQARRDEGEQQVERDRAESEPDGRYDERKGITASFNPIVV